MPANYQSLYRRFRPQRFSEVLGQDHVTRALRAAVAAESVGHAYLFSGPRGTGKTSTARILAKALNCESPLDGEPCLVCDSCLAIASGSSGEVEELDAASNSGVDAMRWLIQTVATAGVGRWKVYIIDEVHMLSTAASNALLKTLEEPPPHVIFILATTNPQKVLQTVVSRTQHFEFHLLDMDAVGEVVDDIASRTGVELTGATRQWVLRRGRGSARDTLSVLEQVLASDQVIPEVDASIDTAVTSLLELDPGATITELEELLQAGNDPLWVVSEMLGRIKDQFLAQLTGAVGPYPLGRITKAMETLGRLSIGVRDALDPGVVLEAVVVQLITEMGGADLEERVRRLEEAIERGGVLSQRRPAESEEPVAPQASAPVSASRGGTSRATHSTGGDLARLRGAIGRSSGREQAHAANPQTPRSPEPVDRQQAASGVGPIDAPAGNSELSQGPAEDPRPQPSDTEPAVIPPSPIRGVEVSNDGQRTPAMQAGVQSAESQGISERAPEPDIEAPIPSGEGLQEVTAHLSVMTQAKVTAQAKAATQAKVTAEPTLDLAATERLRALLQSEWLERFLVALPQRNIRTWIRDTRLSVLGPGEIAIVLDHETRRMKLEPYVAQIVATIRELYGSGLTIRLLLETEVEGGAPTATSPSENCDDPALEPDDDIGDSTPTQKFSDEAIAANVAEVFPGARLIQGEL